MAKRGRPRSGLRRILAAASWLYLAAVLGMWAVIWLGGDRWWWATLIVFGPRWVAAAPLALLLPAATVLRRRSLVLLAAAGIVVVWPIMGLCLPWRSLLPGDERATMIRVLTCNIGGGFQVDDLPRLLLEERPHVVALQECRSGFKIPAELKTGWHAARHGTLCVLSRFPIVQSTTLQSSELGRRSGPGLRCDLKTPCGVVHFFCLHLRTPRRGLETVLAEGFGGAAAMEETTLRREADSVLARRWIDEAEGPVLIAGDFNMPVDAGIYRQNWSGFSNAFGTAGLGWGWTKFTRTIRIRIDHILASDDWRIVSCHVEPPRGGDHRPVTAEVQLRDPRSP